MVTRIADEIVLQKDFLSKKTLKTIYFGGGTPSVLSEKELNLIFESIHKTFLLGQNLEITLEANPDDLTLENLKLFRKLGINRLSIGAQSFDDLQLQWMNRAHNSSQSEQSIMNAREAGFDNINVDLIYGIRDSNKDSLLRNLNKLLSFDPEHISAYCLTIEEGTTFGKWLSMGKITELDENVSFEQYETLINHLSYNGLDQYEISNFSKPGKVSKHNSIYWENKEYLGVGPSAHSYNGQKRFSNISNNGNYMKAIANKTIPAQIEELTLKQRTNEFIMTQLRKNDGLNSSDLLANFGFDLFLVKSKELQMLESNNNIKIIEGKISLTLKGRFVSNSVISFLLN